MIVAIRPDSGVPHGAGHVMRCLALAEELDRRGAEVVWVLDPDPIAWVADLLRGHGWSVLVGASVTESSGSLIALRPEVVVLDSYCTTPLSAVEVRAAGIPVIAIVDDATPAYEADLYVAPSLGSNWDSPRPDSPYLAGLDFVLIRRELRDLAGAKVRTRIADSLQVACLFGGADPRGVARQVVLSLGELGRPMTIDVVPSSEALELTSAALPSGYLLRAHSPGGDFIEVARSADFVISAAGVSSWELLYLGVDLGLIQVADNQSANYREMTQQGWAVGLGKVPDWPSIDAAIGSWAAGWSAAQRPPGTRGTDGLGAERVASAIEAMLAER